MLKAIFQIFFKKIIEQHSANSSCKTFLLFFSKLWKIWKIFGQDEKDILGTMDLAFWLTSCTLQTHTWKLFTYGKIFAHGKIKSGR